MLKLKLIVEFNEDKKEMGFWEKSKISIKIDEV